MMVWFNTREDMRKAWDAALMAHYLHQFAGGPAPDFDKWLAEQRKQPPIARGAA